MERGRLDDGVYLPLFFYAFSGCHPMQLHLFAAEINEPADEK